MTIGQHLLNIAEAGLAIAAEEGSSHRDSTLILIVLLDIEDALDKGRALILDSGQEFKADVNVKTDKIREVIGEMLAELGPEQAKRFLEDRGESAKRRFHVQS